MSKAVAELIAALPGSTFDNTGGGCMVVAWPAGNGGAIVITGIYGRSGGDNFSRGDDRTNVADDSLTGFDAWFHPAWFDGDGAYDSEDGQQVYTSDDFDATGDLDINGWWPDDEYEFTCAQNEAHAVAEVPRVAVTAHDFARNLRMGK
ncbi:MAG: hypothetical protein ACRDPS_09635 [Nocardioides sp.]|uniref:hypothetical protein n=1 Tax=Nocardioides sp. TaxID=35761 RepID=UPI003D6B6C98